MRRFLVAFLLFISTAYAEVAVIVHPKNNLDTLQPLAVQDIFLGRTRVFPNGKFALPIDQSSPLRARFYQKLTSRPIAQINAYWARIIFTGQASPPLQLPDDKAVLQTVRENEGAIGYVEQSSVDETVRVVLELP